MKQYVFYSWQSDLDSKDNRNFIQGCIKKALNELNINDSIGINLRLDSDTKDVMGTPDISDTIFKKIDKSILFIADVSIINGKATTRKTPNPNVLIELGYAAKVLGWERIICLINTDYGSFDDLPFDIKFRRPISYSLNGKNKTEVKKQIVETIKSNISSVDSNGFIEVNEVGSYLVLETSSFYSFLEEELKRIMKDSKLQKKYGFKNNSYSIEVNDDLMYRIDNDEPSEETDIIYYLSIEFTDDSYSYKEVKNRRCSVDFQLMEKFKQVNFNNNKVYTAFEIISRGHSPSGKRDYNKLSEEILKRLGNSSK